MTLIEKADLLAEQAHKGQTRKESDVPYITHPRAVAEILAKHGCNEEVVAAALVHDVLEDTSVTPEQVERELGPEVLSLVQAVSYDKTLPWEEQRIKYIDDVRAASEEAKAISLADKIHNAQSLIAGHRAQGKAMWAHFSRGRDKKLWFEEEMLKMLRESWQHPLVDEYASLVEEMKALEY